MSAALYDRNNQIQIDTLTLTHHSVKTKTLDISQVMEQFILYEDMFQSAISAKLIIRDQDNIVGAMPIVGGETIEIKYKTPVYTESVALKFIVYKIGDRGITNSAENIQINTLFLCTPEVWWSANNLISAGYKGTYSDIITTILKETDTKKKLDKEESIGIVNYVSPNINAFSAIKFCSDNANAKSQSPMFFWETPLTYRLKSLKELYRDKQYKFIYIEDRKVNGADNNAEKTFNTTYQFEYLPSNDRLRQFSDDAFGHEALIFDLTNARIETKLKYSYEDMFNKDDIKLNKFPLNDDSKSSRTNMIMMNTFQDNSHLTDFNRKASLALMDNIRVVINIPGDSAMQSGDVVWMDIPSRAGVSVGPEALTSGKWIVRSIKHLIQKNVYSMICELTKDSFDVSVNE